MEAAVKLNPKKRSCREITNDELSDPHKEVLLMLRDQRKKMDDIQEHIAYMVSQNLVKLTPEKSEDDQ